MIPDLCRHCRHYDEGEYGEYGTRLSGPYCLLNVKMPTRTGFCWRHQPLPLAFSPTGGIGSPNVPQPWLYTRLRGRFWQVFFLMTQYWRTLERQQRGNA